MTTSGSEPITKSIERLKRPGVLPGSDQTPVEVLETHISVIFLTQERAYKLKKPLDLGFLDFSDAKKRNSACREELRVNRRLAPDVYLGLAPVDFAEDGLTTVGQPVFDPPPCDELLITMVRLPEGRMLDRLLDEGVVEDRDIDRLARVLWEYHVTADAGPQVSRYGSADWIRRVLEESYDQAESLCGRLFDEAGHRVARIRTSRFLDSRTRLLERRVQEGRIRETHGDLHTRNVCLLEDGRSVFYDGLDFSAAYRCTDVAAEIAFLAMDLEVRGHEGLSRRLVKRYSELSGDADLRALLPLYKAYRALVRAKVLSIRWTEAAKGSAARADAAEDARRFHAHVVRQSEALTPPGLVVLAGTTATGKTSVANALADRAGFEVLETDRVRKQLAGTDPESPAAAAPGEGIYSKALTKATYRALLRDARELIERDLVAVISGTFLSGDQQAAVVDLAESCRSSLLFVILSAPEEVILSRLALRGAGISDVDARVYHWLRSTSEGFSDIPEQLILRFDTAGRQPIEIAESILTRLRIPFESEEGLSR